MSVWRLRLHAQSWTVEKINEDGTEGVPTAVFPGETLVLRDTEPGALEWRGGMMTAVIPTPLEGRARWQLFSDEELRWMKSGIYAGEVEALLPERDEPGSEAFIEFASGLTEACENREDEGE